MMKNCNAITEAHLLEFYQELERVLKQIAQGIIPLTKENLLSDRDVYEMMGVTSRTLRKYRQLHYLGYVKMNGLIFYIKPLLFLDLMRMYNKKKKEP